jgi:hypothetical protein
MWRDPERHSGAACFYGTRVPIRILFDYLAEGEPLAHFLDAYPPHRAGRGPRRGAAGWGLPRPARRWQDRQEDHRDEHRDQQPEVGCLDGIRNRQLVGEDEGRP